MSPALWELKPMNSWQVELPRRRLIVWQIRFVASHSSKFDKNNKLYHGANTFAPITHDNCYFSKFCLRLKSREAPMFIRYSLYMILQSRFAGNVIIVTRYNAMQLKEFLNKWDALSTFLKLTYFFETYY